MFNADRCLLIRDLYDRSGPFPGEIGVAHMLAVVRGVEQVERDAHALCPSGAGRSGESEIPC